MGGGEARTDALESLRDGGEVRAQRAARRRGLDDRDFADFFRALDRLTLPAFRRTLEVAHQDGAHQARLARARDARNNHQLAERDLDIDAVQVVCARAADAQAAARARAAFAREAERAGERAAGGRRRIRADFRDRALRHDLAAAPPGARAEID